MKPFGKKKSEPVESTLSDEHQSFITYFDKVFESDEYKQRRKKMNNWLELYKAELWKDEIPEGESRVQVNYIFSAIQTLCPLLTDNKPVGYLRARAPLYQEMASLYRMAYDYSWDVQDMDDVFYRAVKDCLLWPIGLTKTYYDPEKEDIATDVVDPRTYALAPGYTDNWDAPWQGEKAEKPLSWIADHFPEKLNKVKPLAQGENETRNSDKSLMRLMSESATVYEIWIKDPQTEDYIIEHAAEFDDEGKIVKDASEEKAKRKKYPDGRWVTLTNTVDLDDRPSPFSHGKAPYVVWRDYSVNHDFWGMGEPQQIEGLHREVNKQLQKIVKHTRIQNDPNFLVDEDCNLSPDDLKKGLAEGGNVWPVSFRGTDTPVRVIDSGRVDEAVIQLMNILPNAIEESSGIVQFMKGQAAKKERQSASEVSVMIESSYTRVRQKVRNVEWSLKRHMEITTELMQEFYKLPRYFSFKRGDEEGMQLEYGMISNQRKMLGQVNKPSNIKQFPGDKEATELNEGEYQDVLDHDEIWQQTVKLLEDKEGELDPVIFPFITEIQTNSTLPMDKQTLANLYLRLAQITVTPDSIVDAEAVLDGLHIPNKEAILHRKKREKEDFMRARQSMLQRRAGPPPSPMPGTVPQPALAPEGGAAA